MDTNLSSDFGEYPTASTACRIAGNSVTWGSNVIRADCEAKVAVAVRTPSTPNRAFSTVWTQWPQVMPASCTVVDSTVTSLTGFSPEPAWCPCQARRPRC